MTTKVLIAIGIVWLVVVLIGLCVPTNFVIGFWSKTSLGGPTLLRFFRTALAVLPAVFWIGWTLPLAVAAYRLAQGH